MEKVYRLGELFCGPGGIGAGAGLLNKIAQDGGLPFEIHHRWATDIDFDSCSTYYRNFISETPLVAPIGNEPGFFKASDDGVRYAKIHSTKSAVIQADVRKLDFEKLPSIDILTFGFPCNDFSIVGARPGLKGKFGPLYREGVRALNALRPIAFVAENVSGLRSSDEGRTLKLIEKELGIAGPGYDVVSHLFKFEKYGVPQMRHRMIFVGISKDVSQKQKRDFKIPLETHLNKYVGAKVALKKIPKTALHQEKTRQAQRVIDRLICIKPGENAWTANLPENLKLNVRGAKLSQIYKRLVAGKPAYTITGSGGGGTHVYHWKKPRALTNRERARLQTFSDLHNFSGKKESVRRQIGMAVPPRGAQVILLSLLNTLHGREYPASEN